MCIKVKFTFSCDDESVNKTNLELYKDVYKRQSEGDAGVLTSEQTTQKEEADHKVSETLTSTQGEVTQEDTTSYDAMGREVSSTDQNTGCLLYTSRCV